MKRLNFTREIPDFTRVVWVSDEARRVWEPIVSRVSNAFQALERLSVAYELKPATLQDVAPHQLPEASQWAVKNGLHLVVLSQQGESQQYAASAVPFEQGKPFIYRAAYLHQNIADLFIEFWKDQNNVMIGSALGFPECCRNFFERYWVSEQWVDTTLPMVYGENVHEQRHYHVAGPAECNILLRWLGVRPVSHLPCSFHCEATNDWARRLARFGAEMGYGQEIEWLYQMLNWPIRWSSLHGVAMIETPVLKIVTRSDALPEVITIDRDGPAYPAEGAIGNHFPFKKERPRALHFVRRVASCEENGFKSDNAMNVAHDLVLSALRTNMQVHPLAKVLDLGCGNGLLLRKIKDEFSVPVSGVEIRKIKDSYVAEIENCDIKDFAWRTVYAAVLISYNRLNEMEDEAMMNLLSQIKRFSRLLLILNYGDKKADRIVDETISSKFKMRGAIRINSHQYEVAVLEPLDASDQVQS